MAEVHLLKRDFPAALELYETLLREVPDSPKVWNERGVVLHQAGRPDDALSSYKQAVEIDPKYALAWNNLGVLQTHRADNEDAIESLRTALQLQGTFSAARLNLALLLYQLRRFQLSLEAYRQVLQSEPASAAAWNGIGLVLVELKRFPDARNAFVRAVEADPEHAPAAEPPAAKSADDPLALARDYVSKGLMDVAAAEAVRAVQRGADKGDAAVLVGDIFAKRGLHGEAQDRYREARALDPQRADALLGEVKALFALGGARAEEARALAEQLLTLTPDDVDALVAVAKGRAAAGDAAGALTALQQAQTRAPGRADLHKLQGDVTLKVGNKGGALAAYQAALELDPGYVQVWLDLGRLHEAKEELAEAQKAYEHALEALPTFHEAALALADLLRRTGRARAAVVRLAGMLEQDPYDLHALLPLGRAPLDEKRDEQALAAFRRALKFDPDQGEAPFQQSRVLARLHRYGEAVQVWEKVTRLDPSGPFAQAARAHARTALDLQHIFTSDAA